MKRAAQGLCCLMCVCTCLYEKVSVNVAGGSDGVAHDGLASKEDIKGPRLTRETGVVPFIATAEPSRSLSGYSPPLCKRQRLHLRSTESFWMDKTFKTVESGVVGT